jgi:putative hydrolase of the HAD superfamily
MAIRTVVFDFGNVIGFFDHRIAIDNLAMHAGLPAETIRQCLFTDELEDAYESGRLSTPDLLQYARQTCGFRCSDEDLITAIGDMFWPNEDICALLPRLKSHYRLVLLSNTNDIHSRYFRLQFAEHLSHFDALVLSHEVGIRKPTLAIYEHCLGLAGCAPSECVFIDDLAANIAAARACGWHGIVYTDIDALRREFEALGIVV